VTDDFMRVLNEARISLRARRASYLNTAAEEGRTRWGACRRWRHVFFTTGEDRTSFAA
jgi:hypothetical protein